MKKINLFAILVALLFALPSCQKSLSPDDAKEVVLKGEIERIPLYIQELDLLDLTIDSLIIFNDIEPMSGLLYTTWTYEVTEYDYSRHPRTIDKLKKTQKLIVQVSDIQRCSEDKRLIEWYSNWNSVKSKLERKVTKF